MSQSPQSLLNVEKVGDVNVVRFNLPAMIGHDMVRSVGDQLANLVGKEEHPLLLLDLSGIKFMTSLMLSKLMTVNKNIQSAGGRMALCSVAPEVSQVFKVTYLDKILNIFNDKSEALQSFKP